MILGLCIVIALVVAVLAGVSTNELVKELRREQVAHMALKNELQVLEMRLRPKLKPTTDRDFVAGWNMAMEQVRIWLKEVR